MSPERRRLTAAARSQSGRRSARARAQAIGEELLVDVLAGGAADQRAVDRGFGADEGAERGGDRGGARLVTEERPELGLSGFPAAQTSPGDDPEEAEGGGRLGGLGDDLERACGVALDEETPGPLRRPPGAE